MWSPTDADGLPVMFWIYGGGLRAGSAHQPYYLGDDLASEGVVVVGANYRLGAFGFLATDELADDSDDGSFGNYGLADQAAALEWVQENVAAFGGDPDNVPGDGWEPYAESSRVTLLDARFELVDEIRGGRCDAVTEPASVRR